MKYVRNLIFFISEVSAQEMRGKKKRMTYKIMSGINLADGRMRSYRMRDVHL